MRNKLLLIAAAALLASCAGAPVRDEASKRKELQKYKQQVHELEQKISLLENELSGMGNEELVNVEATEVQPQLFEHFIEVTGNAEADLDINVSPESIGVIEQILVAEGQRVSRGQQLAVLNTDALEQSIEEMKVQLSLARTTFERQKNLWDQNIGSEMQYLQARTNVEAMEKRIGSLEAQVEMSVVASPVDGVVDVIYQKKGEIGSPQMPFARVLNIDQIKVYAEVSETYLTRVDNGDKVTIYFPALEREIEAPIQRVGNVIDPMNRTFKVRLNLRNSDRMIKPNLVCVIRIRDYFSEEAVVIPSLLIKEDFRGKYTYISEEQDGKSFARKVYIETGSTSNNLTEITGGLVPGMKIITEGFAQVSDGTPINI